MDSKYTAMLDSFKEDVDNIVEEVKLDIMEMVKNNEVDYYKTDLYKALAQFELQNRSNDDPSVVIMVKTVNELNHLASSAFYVAKDFYIKNRAKEETGINPSELNDLV